MNLNFLFRPTQMYPKHATKKKKKNRMGIMLMVDEGWLLAEKGRQRDPWQKANVIRNVLDNRQVKKACII